MFLGRGCTCTHETVRDGATRFTPLLAEGLRAKRHGAAGGKWHADEIDVEVDGRWCSLYRALGRTGNLVDARLSLTRDREAAQQCFRQTLAIAGPAPEQVTTDGHDASPRAIRETRGVGVTHRCSRYKNKRLEQDHRGIKQRYYPLRGFGPFEAAARCCSAHDERRDHRRSRHRPNETVSLAAQRRVFQDRRGDVCAVLQAA